MLYLKYNTAVTVRVGPFLDDTDGKTAETALSIAQADVRLSKNNSTFGQKSDATAATHEEFGWYQIPLNTTDTNTMGPLQMAIHKTGALPVFSEFMVVSENSYNSVTAGDLTTLINGIPSATVTAIENSTEINIQHKATPPRT